MLKAEICIRVPRLADALHTADRPDSASAVDAAFEVTALAVLRKPAYPKQQRMHPSPKLDYSSQAELRYTRNCNGQGASSVRR